MELQRVACHRWWDFSPLSLSPITVSRRRLTFIDAAELGPGFNLSFSVSSGPIASTATPEPIGGRHSKAGLIAGGIVGGIAVISLLVAASFFYRRWCQQRAAKSAGDGQSAVVAFNTPMLSRTPSRA